MTEHQAVPQRARQGSTQSHPHSHSHGAMSAAAFPTGIQLAASAPGLLLSTTAMFRHAAAATASAGSLSVPLSSPLVVTRSSAKRAAPLGGDEVEFGVLTDLQQVLLAQQANAVKYVKIFSGLPRDTQWYRMTLTGDQLAGVRIVRCPVTLALVFLLSLLSRCAENVLQVPSCAGPSYCLCVSARCATTAGRLSSASACH